MSIKITPIDTNTHKNKYHIEVECMHGDGDKETYHTYKCADAADFKRVMTAMKYMPLPSSSGGDASAYNKWCEETFGEGFVPWDVIYTDTLTSVEHLTGFYYDENGVKYSAEIE